MGDTEELSFLQKLDRMSEDVEDSTDDTTMLESFEDEKAYRAFHVSRGVRPPQMLIVNFKTGLLDAFDYSHLYRIQYMPADGSVVLRFSEDDLTISGVNLLDGVRRLTLRRVLQIFEADRPTAMSSKDNEPVITEIVVRKRATLLGDSMMVTP